MRVTNKMMNLNSMNNINRNKEYLDKLNSQLASEKKITRPSDDPVIAIRALKLRTNLTEITQYYEKNTKDAKAWLQATQDAVESTKDILTQMKAQFTSGATGTNTTESRNAILEELKALRKQIYDNGNADYAGRCVFTGFRTSEKLTFQEADDLNVKYTGIEESFVPADIEKIKYVSGRLDNNKVSNAATTAVDETEVKYNDVYRIRLAYDNLDNVAAPGDITYIDSDGNTQTIPVTTMSLSNGDAAYKAAAGVNFIPETGELILSEDAMTKLSAASEISFSYDKSSWIAGDLRPEHYFNCVDETNGITFDDHSHDISYDISANQSLQVNSTAPDIFKHSIGRDVDEMISAIESVEASNTRLSKLRQMMTEAKTDLEKKNIQTAIDAAEKEFTFVQSKMQGMFENNLTNFDNYVTIATLEGTKVGTKLTRLDLVQNRLMDLQTTAKELASENENVDVAEVTINMSEAKLCYNAALMATGQISQQSLLSYI